MGDRGYQTRFTYALDSCHAEVRMIYESLPYNWIWAWAEWKEKQDANIQQHQQHQVYQKSDVAVGYAGMQQWLLHTSVHQLCKWRQIWECYAVGWSDKTAPTRIILSRGSST